MRKIIFFSILTILLATPLHRLWAKPFDNTTCFVLSGEDSEEYYNSLRRKIEDGWNRTETRLCTQAINFVNVPKVTLESPLDINNENASDCSKGPDKPDVCGDGLSLLIDGGPSRVTFDVSAVSADSCAISIHANHVKITHIDIIATSQQEQANKVLCDEGEGNDTDDVNINGHHHPSPSPTPTPKPTPSPTPKPTPSPTPKPTPSPTPSASPQATPSASPEASASPEPVPSSTPSLSPNPSGSGDNGGVSSFGGCDGGTKSGCSITAPDSPRNYLNYLVGIAALLGFSLFKRIRHKG